VKAMGVGRYTSTVGFNLAEAFQGVISLIDDPDAKFELYPEDPKGCVLINKKDLTKILDKTDLKVKMRATYDVIHENGKEIIEIKNTPFEVSPTTVTEAIRKLAEKGQLPEIVDVGSSSDEDNLGGTCIISIDVKKGYDANAVMTKLFKKTDLECTYVTKYSFVNGLQSVDYTVRIAILEWIKYRRQTLKRMYKIRRVNILKRMHFLEPLIKVIESGEIDEFIRIVRKNKSTDAVPKIMKKFNLTDYQAQRIIGVTISQLALDKLADYKKELAELKVEDEKLNEIIKSKKKLNKVIISQMEDGIKKYGQARKTKVTQLIDRIDIPDTLHYLIFTNKYIKKLPYEDKGYRIGRLDSGEKVLKVMAVNNRDKISIFSSDGKCLPIDVNDISNSSLQSVGLSYAQLGISGGFAGCFQMKDDNDDFIVTVTANGLISKTPYDEILDKKKICAFMKLGKDDYVTGVTLSSKKDELLIYTSDGKAAVFPFDDFETTSRNTKGVQSIKLSDEKVIGVTSIKKKDNTLIIMTDRGYMKQFPIKNIPDTKRNGKGIDVNSGNGNLIKVKPINIEDTNVLFICCTDGTYELDPINIKSKSRVSKNQRVIELKSTDYAFDIM
jgi:DNA gyrase subunit A